uniref:FecR family protein n=1 Tax=uncultured Draconibacterium sp. TaxID=1573823 RepID=UPI003216A3FA
MEKQNLDILLSDIQFQNGLAEFELWSMPQKKLFLKKYGLTQKQFVEAKTIVDGLAFKERTFSDHELDYLWNTISFENISTKETKKGQISLGWFRKIAAILILPVIGFSAYLLLQNIELNNFKEEKVEMLSDLYNTVYAPLGGKTKALLPDGSEVWLNSGSSLKYPVLGNSNYREVLLNGEAFFKVKKNPDVPMFVKTSDMDVKVYGTSFNVNAYSDNEDISVVLVEGKVSLSTKTGENGKEIFLTPGEIGTLNKTRKHVFIAKASNTLQYTGWMNGIHVFRNTRFKTILNRLEKIYNVEFILDDKQLGEYYFDATFEGQNIDKIMDIFQVSLPIKWQRINTGKQQENYFGLETIKITRDETRILKK